MAVLYSSDDVIRTARLVLRPLRDGDEARIDMPHVSTSLSRTDFAARTGAG